MTKLECTLCESRAARTLSDGGLSFSFCDTCIGAFTDRTSGYGRVLRRAAKTVIRRIAMRLHPDKYDSPEQRAHYKRAREKYKSNPKNQPKEQARNAVSHALKKGTLIRPDACQRCGRTPPPHRNGQSPIWFHHTHGYERANWLLGEWLCYHCHRLSEPTYVHKGTYALTEDTTPEGSS